MWTVTDCDDVFWAWQPNYYWYEWAAVVDLQAVVDMYNVAEVVVAVAAAAVGDNEAAAQDSEAFVGADCLLRLNVLANVAVVVAADDDDYVVDVDVAVAVEQLLNVQAHNIEKKNMDFDFDLNLNLNSDSNLDSDSYCKWHWHLFRQLHFAHFQGDDSEKQKLLQN